MLTYTAVIERCPDTGLFVGYVPGLPGAHSQGATLDELNANLKEVIEMLSQDGPPKLEAEFVGIQTVNVAQLMGSVPVLPHAAVLPKAKATPAAYMSMRAACVLISRS